MKLLESVLVIHTVAIAGWQVATLIRRFFYSPSIPQITLFFPFVGMRLQFASQQFALAPLRKATAILFPLAGGKNESQEGYNERPNLKNRKQDHLFLR